MDDDGDGILDVNDFCPFGRPLRGIQSSNRMGATTLQETQDLIPIKVSLGPGWTSTASMSSSVGLASSPPFSERSASFCDGPCETVPTFNFRPKSRP